jgi:hypothetical protein
MLTATKLYAATALTAVAVLSSTAVAAARPAAVGHTPPNATTVPVRIHHDLPVGAGATGETGITNEQCQAYADGVNDVLETTQKVLNNIGNGPLYDEGIALARSIEDDAENAGCFVINPV